MTTLPSTPHSGRLPDFVIAGAPRCGTTWLYRALERHPSLWLAKPVRPEPKFFLVDEEYQRGLTHYSETWFSEAPARVLTGEKSTNYLESPRAAERLAHDVPSARLVFLLREPAERAFSHYRFTKMHGLEDLDFEQALERESEREPSYEGALRYSRPFSYFTRGLYARHLQSWLTRFPRHQIFIGRYEDILSDPSALVAQVHAFLGVDRRPDDAAGLGVVNGADAGDAAPSTLTLLRKRYIEPNDQLYALLGERLWSDE